MSRYIGDKDPTDILIAADHWRQRSLLADGSVFTDKSLWLPAHLEALDEFFVGNLDEGGGDIYEKLERQLEPTMPEVKQLTAEMFWLMLLCPSNVTEKNKLETIGKIWNWSGELLPSQIPWLNSKTLKGIGSAGTGFNTNRWRELIFFIKMMLAFKQLSQSEREQVVSDGWIFADWIQGIPESESRQLRHMILYLLFPDDFERIFGGDNRRTIVQAISGISNSEMRQLPALDLDRELLRIRNEKEEKYKTSELDYFASPLRELWFKDKQRTTRAAFEPVDDTTKITVTDLGRREIPELPEVHRDGSPFNRNLIYKKLLHSPTVAAHRAACKADGLITGKEDIRRAEQFGWIELDEPTDSIIIGPTHSELLGQIFDELTQFKPGDPVGSEDEIWGLFESFAWGIRSSAAVQKFPTINVNWSVGKGRFAKVPWLAFLDGRETKTTREGVYCVILFREDKSGCYLTFNQGVTEPIREHGETKAVEFLIAQAKSLRAKYQELQGKGFHLDEGIDLRTGSGIGERYQESTIAYKLYDALDLPSDEELLSDLEAVLAVYDRYMIDKLQNTEASQVSEDEGTRLCLKTLDQWFDMV